MANLYQVNLIAESVSSPWAVLCEKAGADNIQVSDFVLKGHPPNARFFVNIKTMGKSFEGHGKQKYLSFTF